MPFRGQTARHFGGETPQIPQSVGKSRLFRHAAEKTKEVLPELSGAIYTLAVAQEDHEISVSFSPYFLNLLDIDDAGAADPGKGT